MECEFCQSSRQHVSLTSLLLNLAPKVLAQSSSLLAAIISALLTDGLMQFFRSSVETSISVEVSSETVIQWNFI